MRSRLGASLFAALGLAILLGLGTWQLQRLAWKTALIESVAEGLKLPPRPVEALIADPPAASRDYLPVSARGSFDHAREIHVFTQLEEPKGGPARGLGYWVMTPFNLASGGTVLVNRGFVPLDRKDPATRAGGQVQGELEIAGISRMSQPRSWFDNADDRARNVWYVRDTGVMAAALGIALRTPLFIDMTGPAPPGGLPQVGETRLEFPNRHLEYALTWYGLAATLVGVYIAFMLSGRRRGAAGGPA